MADTEILLAMQGAVRKAVSEAANTEIEKQKHRFECKMGEVKRDMVAKIVNEIQITASRNLPSGAYVIQIRLGGGSNG